jgi:hypothetical protein
MLGLLPGILQLTATQRSIKGSPSYQSAHVQPVNRFQAALGALTFRRSPDLLPIQRAERPSVYATRHFALLRRQTGLSNDFGVYDILDTQQQVLSVFPACFLLGTSCRVVLIANCLAHWLFHESKCADCRLAG